MLDQISFTGNLAGLFYRGVNWRDPQQLHACEHAFKNLVLYYAETTWPELLKSIRFDDVQLEIMLRRFYRDAFGVFYFGSRLNELCPDKTHKALREAIWNELDRLSIRINSAKPRKTRIAAVFSLWMATFRPIYFIDKPKVDSAWCFQAAANFYLASSFLGFYGEVRVGSPGHDRNTRIQRIYYDFTCRDLNLSSLEMLYCSVFVPDAPTAAQEARDKLGEVESIKV